MISKCKDRQGNNNTNFNNDNIINYNNNNRFIYITEIRKS